MNHTCYKSVGGLLGWVAITAMASGQSANDPRRRPAAAAPAIQPAPQQIYRPAPQPTYRPAPQAQPGPAWQFRQPLQPGGQPKPHNVQTAPHKSPGSVTPHKETQATVMKPKNGSLPMMQKDTRGNVTREEHDGKDGSKVITTYTRTGGGKILSTQTIHQNALGIAVSKTVVVRQPVALSRKTALSASGSTRYYDHGRYGFVYHPGRSDRRAIMAFRSNHLWFNDAGLPLCNPFRYAWNWESYAWYRHGHAYWNNYVVYPNPVYWVTDRLIGSYLADYYYATAFAGGESRPGEVADCPTQGRDAGTGPEATPINDELKENLRSQVEKTIAEEQNRPVEDGVATDLAKALADPAHIYPVSGTLSATEAGDASKSTSVTDGDLLRLEPAQVDILANANENTLVVMRVMASKGEEGEAKAGTLLSIPLKSLQEFDNEFRARINQGLADAAVNGKLFKKDT